MHKLDSLKVFYQKRPDCGETCPLLGGRLLETVLKRITRTPADSSTVLRATQNARNPWRKVRKYIAPFTIMFCYQFVHDRTILKRCIHALSKKWDYSMGCISKYQGLILKMKFITRQTRFNQCSYASCWAG